MGQWADREMILFLVATVIKEKETLQRATIILRIIMLMTLNILQILTLIIKVRLKIQNLNKKILVIWKIIRVRLLGIKDITLPIILVLQNIKLLTCWMTLNYLVWQARFQRNIQTNINPLTLANSYLIGIIHIRVIGRKAHTILIIKATQLTL